MNENAPIVNSAWHVCFPCTLLSCREKSPSWKRIYADIDTVKQKNVKKVITVIKMSETIKSRYEDETERDVCESDRRFLESLSENIKRDKEHLQCPDQGPDVHRYIIYSNAFDEVDCYYLLLILISLAVVAVLVFFIFSVFY